MWSVKTKRGELHELTTEQMLHEIQLGNIKRDDQVMFEGGDWKPIVEHPELLNKIQRVETNSTARMVALIVVPLLLLVCGFMSRF